MARRSDQAKEDRKRSDDRVEDAGTIWIPQLPSDQQADYERLKRELRVVEIALEDGHKDKPSPSDTKLNEAQARITSRIFAGIASLNRFLCDKLTTAVAQAGRDTPELRSAKFAEAEIRAQVADVLSQHRQQLISLKEEEEDTGRDLRFFRRKNELNRMAKYPDSVLLFWVLMAGMALIESMFNAFLLQKISEQGWLGGVFLAFLISAVNVVLGLGAGLVGWRLLGHKAFVAKMGGGLFAVICHSIALGWNIFVAHFRETIEIASLNTAENASVIQAANNTLDHIRTQGVFGLSTIYSWGLLFLGLTVHIVASSHSWSHLADKYWDYASWDKTHRLAREAYEAELADLKDQATAAAGETVAESEKLAQRSQRHKERLKGLVEQGERLREEVQDSEAKWVRDGNALLKSYREENRIVRSSDPPRYWTEYPTAHQYRKAQKSGSHESEGDLDVFAAEESAQRSLQQLREMAATAERIQTTNAESFAVVRAAYAKRMGELDKDIADFKRSVDAEAVERVKAARRLDNDDVPSAPPRASEGAHAH